MAKEKEVLDRETIELGKDNMEANRDLLRQLLKNAQSSLAAESSTFTSIEIFQDQNTATDQE